MCRKNEVDCSFIKLFLQFFYNRIQYDKTHNVAHGEAFEVPYSKKNIPILGLELKRHIIYYKCPICIQFFHLCFWH